MLQLSWWNVKLSYNQTSEKDVIKEIEGPASMGLGGLWPDAAAQADILRISTGNNSGYGGAMTLRNCIFLETDELIQYS